MNKHEEIIFNLFIIKFWANYFYKDSLEVDEYTYDLNIQSPLFKILKDCFPENEVSDIDIFHRGDKTYYSTFNFIAKELEK